METVDFIFKEKSAKYAKMSLKLPRQNKNALKTIDFNFLPIFVLRCFNITHLDKICKNDFVYFEIFSFLTPC